MVKPSSCAPKNGCADHQFRLLSNLAAAFIMLLRHFFPTILISSSLMHLRCLYPNSAGTMRNLLSAGKSAVVDIDVDPTLSEVKVAVHSGEGKEGLGSFLFFPPSIVYKIVGYSCCHCPSLHAAVPGSIRRVTKGSLIISWLPCGVAERVYSMEWVGVFFFLLLSPSPAFLLFDLAGARTHARTHAHTHSMRARARARSLSASAFFVAQFAYFGTGGSRW